MTNKLPVSRVVRVGVNLTPAGAQSQSLSDLLVLGRSVIIDPSEGMRTYSSLAEVAADFGTACEEYYAAAKWFGQKPQPTQILVGRWSGAPTSGGLNGGVPAYADRQAAAWAAIADGSFSVVLDADASIDVNGLDFSGVGNLNAVAAIIDAAMAGATVTWNAVARRFEFRSIETGVISKVDYLDVDSGAVGTDISSMLGGLLGQGANSFAGTAGTSAVDAVADFDNRFGQRWYGLFMPGATTDNDIKAVAAYIEAATNKHVYGLTTLDANVLVGAATTDIAYQLKALGYMRTLVQYSSDTIYAIVSAMARILTTNYEGSDTVITLKFKQEPGVIAEELSTTQANAAEVKHANVFVAYDNDTAILEQGVMANGTFVDVVTSTDWLAVTIQRDIFNLLYTGRTKIPQTDQGMHILTTSVEARCSQAVRNGMVAPGVWNSEGFGTLAEGDYLAKGYYVWNDVVANQSQSDRTARLAMPIQVAVKLAGAIHSCDVAINVNQ